MATIRVCFMDLMQNGMMTSSGESFWSVCVKFADMLCHLYVGISALIVGSTVQHYFYLCSASISEFLFSSKLKAKLSFIRRTCMVEQRYRSIHSLPRL